MLIVAATVIAATPAIAQNTEDQNAFDFSLPGARSRGIGGAFVAIADDATSVYSNPAGLTRLFRPEVSIEARHWDRTSRTLHSGHLFGPASGIGADAIDGPVERDFRSGVTGVSFMSVVYPGDRWAAGVFRHQLARYRMDRRIEGPFFDCTGGYRGEAASAPFCEPHARADGVDREFPKQQSLALDIQSTGAAFAYKWPVGLAAGIAVQYFDFRLSSVNKVFTARDGQKYLPPHFADPENLELIGSQSGDDHAWAANAGVLWDVSSRWAVGASFRQGPSFEFATSTVTGPREGSRLIVAQSDNPFRVPDTFSVGVLHRLTNFWHLSFEYDRVNYHQLIDDFRNTALRPGDPESDLVASGVRLDSANQLRFGAEYLWLTPGSRVLAFRGGVWTDPSAQAYFDADPATGLPAPRWAVLLPRRDGTVHLTGGLGFTTRRHFQIDAAVDFSEFVNTLSVSTVWRF